MQKRLLYALVAIAIVAAIAIGYSSTRKRASFVPQNFRLQNGLEVEVAAGTCGGKASSAFVFSVGANQDPPGRSGMVHVIERLLAKPAEQGQAVTMGADNITWSVVAPGGKILDQLDAFATRLAQPGFTEAAVTEAKKEVLADITKRLGTDATLTAFTDAAESVAPSAGRGRRGGIAAEIEGIDLAAINEFWKAHFTAGNARLVLLGDIDAEKARAQIDQAFGKLPTGTPPVARPAGDMTVTGTLVMGDAPTAVSIAVRAPSYKDAAYAPFLVLANRLIKESPGAQEWVASYDPVAQPEVLVISGPVKTGEQPESAAARIRKSVDAILSRPLDPAETTTTRDRFAMFLAQQDHDAIACEKDPRAMAVTFARRNQLGVDTAQIAHGVQVVTAAQLAEGAEFFAPNRTAAVISGGTKR